MKRVFSILAAATALALILAAPASAAFGFKELDTTFSEEDGTAATLAGSHPFSFTTTFGVNTKIVPESYENPETHVLEDGEVPEGEVKNLDIEQIPGLVGSQSAVPRCSSADFNTRVDGRPQCPDSTAVGIVAVKAEFDVFPLNTNVFVHVSVYSLAPSPGEAAKLGFVALNVPIVVDVGVNPNPPYNLLAHLRYVPQAVLFYASQFTIWGNPASEAHDSLRGKCVGDPLESTPQPISLGTCSVNVPEVPFLTMPRACSGPLKTSFSGDSWQNPGVFTKLAFAETHGEAVPPDPQGMTGCESLPFSPTTDAQPTTSQAESPSGLNVNLDVKDEGLTSVTGRAQSDIKRVEVTLPEGVTVNPSAAEGLGVCTKAQYEVASLTVAGCPEAAKLGSVSVISPLLEETLEGSLYLAQQDDAATAEPGAENPFDSLLAFYILIRNDPNGIFVKQAGKVEPNLTSGRLVSTVDEIPQLPFSHFNLHFREGPRAPLATPGLCGTYTTKAVLTPWSGNEAVEANSSFTVSSGVGGGACPAGGVPPFHPGFEAGSINNAAGVYSPFYMRLTRSDGEQDLTRFDSVLPRGVTGKIAGVAKCSDAAIAAAKAKTGRQELSLPSCPSSSEIGHVLAGAGVGPALTYVPGKIYLAGPFGGDPLSIVAIVPAVAGPFDAGTVVTREALTLDPNTAEVQVDGAASDPIPHILKGIPLKLRDLRVYVDRPNFTLNPTSCGKETARATLFGSGADVFNPADDVSASLTDRYQAAGCSSLPFKPKLTLKLKGRTKRNDHPALRAVLTARAGDANIAGASVVLPHSVFLEQAHIRTICTRVQFAANACPRGSIYGKARAFTPLLDEPLEGPVYLRANGGERDLPDLVAALHGVVDFNLVGYIDAVNGRIRSRFQTAPDVPLTKFVLEMRGAKKGLIANSADLCAHTRHAKARFTGHNGKVSKFGPVLGNSCK